ncbi:hypothetical protein ABZ816_08305 [Actinosynnema sp. NPDC047251]|uniref:PE domain-containing protein n=1 Tax=Saccharothrix espanaensis (strain ATCC 51144 / DSM 44229 / JCM 9112 / NBRC 15066 / NRRL 15764) TaxID=1179773 RepID=K0JPY3_SACES|nr:hypothetical protein [Saccharothrix espanaensis]CCH27541.1 hypothetical protein BN6_02080 [Saccharothrix espanaensis DSM 44229]
MAGFRVDPAELALLAGRLDDVAAAGRDHVAWKFDVDTARLPADDPLRAAVEVYQRSLRGALDRLCRETGLTADRLRESTATYLDADRDAAGPLTRGGEGSGRP